MAVKKSQIAYQVRVKLNDQFEEKCLGDKYLKQDSDKGVVLFIAQDAIYNDTKGDYVYLSTRLNSGIAYLNEIDLEFPIGDYGEPKDKPSQIKEAAIELLDVLTELDKREPLDDDLIEKMSKLKTALDENK